MILQVVFAIILLWELFKLCRINDVMIAVRELVDIKRRRLGGEDLPTMTDWTAFVVFVEFGYLAVMGLLLFMETEFRILAFIIVGMFLLKSVFEKMVIIDAEDKPPWYPMYVRWDSAITAAFVFCFLLTSIRGN